jgi:glycosyltransferase involved in cell wall biosynthesis
LAGKPGFGYDKIIQKLQTTRLDSQRLVDARRANYKKDIVLPGFVTDEKKWELLKNADAFLFPTFYEGFGIPVLEAQSVGVPVVASSNSSLEEVCDHSAAMVDPNEPEEIAERTNVLLQDKSYRDDIIKRGYENVKRFSWEKCAQEIAKIITIDGEE